jgi:hypothetical protein
VKRLKLAQVIQVAAYAGVPLRPAAYDSARAAIARASRAKGEVVEMAAQTREANARDCRTRRQRFIRKRPPASVSHRGASVQQGNRAIVKRGRPTAFLPFALCPLRSCPSVDSRLAHPCETLSRAVSKSDDH